jgi:hypothetical protein
MAGRKQRPGGSPEGAAAEAGRRARLAAALRANLAKRKAQKRGRDEAARQAGPDDPEPAPSRELETRPKVK